MKTNTAALVELEEVMLASVTGGEDEVVWDCVEYPGGGWCSEPGSAGHVWWPEGADGGP